MEFLGIGWLELFAILIIILLVAGPKDIERGARGLGRFLNKLNRSPSYQAIRRASNELRNLPQRLAREANLEELQALSQEVRQVKEEVQQVRQEIKESTQSIAGPHKSFQAWVKELPAPDAEPASAPTAPPAPTLPPNGPTPAADPAAPDAK